MRGSQAPDVVLHGVLEDSFLFDDQLTFLVEVCVAEGSPVSIPPLRPLMSSSS
jgi:hypothetical protein